MAPLGFLLNPTEPDSPSPPDPPPQPGPELDPQPSALKRQRSGELCSPLPFEPGLNPGFSAQCSVPEQEGIQQSSQTQHRPQDKAQDELQYTLAPPKKRTKSINWNQVHHATQAQPPSMYASGSIPAFQGTIACLEERKSISGPTSPQTPFGGDQHHGQTGTDSQPQHDPAPSESETSETLPSDSRCHAKQESEGCSHAPLKSHDSASTSQSERDVVADLPDAHDFDRAGLDGRVAQGTSLSTSASGEQDQRLDQGGIDSVIQNQTVSDHDLKDLGVSRHDSREASTKPTAGTTQSAHSSPAPQQLQSNGEVASSASIKAPPKKKGANQSKVKRETESASTSDANSTPRRGGSASATPDPSDARTTEGRSRSNEKEKERKRQRAEKRKREKELQASAALIATQPQERVPGRKDKERGKRSGDVTPILRSLEIGGGEEKDVEEAEEEEEVDGKLYCICKTFYDDDRMMIACDRCDEWFHMKCMKMKDDQAELVDVFICPFCEKLTHDRTTWKTKCLRPTCNHAAQQPISRYCSERCGILLAAARIQKTKYGKGQGLEKLAGKEIQAAKKVEGLVIWAANPSGASSLDDSSYNRQDVTPHKAFTKLSREWFHRLDARRRDRNGDPPLKAHDLFSSGKVHIAPFEMDSLSVKEEEELRNAQIKLASILARKARVEASLDLVASRHKLLQLAEDRVSTLPPARNDSDPSAATVSSKTKKGRGTVTSTSGVGPRCGYDERLSWEDEKLERWCEKDHSQAILKEELPLDGRLDDGTPMANGTASPAEGASSASPTSGGGNGTQQDAPLICSTAKRRCKRHADWSIVRGADFEVEREAQTQALSRLADEERDAAILIRELESIINIRRDTAQKAVARKKEEDAKRDAELAALLARGGTAARKASGPHFNL